MGYISKKSLIGGIDSFRRGQTPNHFCFVGWHRQNKTSGDETCWCMFIDQTLYLSYCTSLFWLDNVDLHVTTCSDCIPARGILYISCRNLSTKFKYQLHIPGSFWFDDINTFYIWNTLQICIKLQIKLEQLRARCNVGCQCNCQKESIQDVYTIYILLLFIYFIINNNNKHGI